METEQSYSKKCMTCLVDKNSSEFGSCRAARDGLYNDCIACRDAMAVTLAAEHEKRFQGLIAKKGNRWGSSSVLARTQNRGVTPRNRFNQLVKRCQYLSSTQIGIISNITTFEEYWDIVKDDMCFYCGGSILCGSGYCLDRIDNLKWYVKDNVRPCCGKCNVAKSDLTESAFKSLMMRISQHWLGMSPKQ